MGTITAAHLLVHCQVHGNFMIMTSARGLGHLELEATWNFSNNRCNPRQQRQRHIMLWGPPKIFKTSIIVGGNRSHTFSFKSWPPYEKNLTPPPIRSHKNSPPQIPTFNLFDFSFPSLRHVSHFPHFLFLSKAISHSYSRTYVVLVWKLSLESRETMRVQY